MSSKDWNIDDYKKGDKFIVTSIDGKNLKAFNVNVGDIAVFKGCVDSFGLFMLSNRDWTTSSSHPYVYFDPSLAQPLDVYNAVAQPCNKEIDTYISKSVWNNVLLDIKQFLRDEDYNNLMCETVLNVLKNNTPFNVVEETEFDKVLKRNSLLDATHMDSNGCLWIIDKFKENLHYRSGVWTVEKNVTPKVLYKIDIEKE